MDLLQNKKILFIFGHGGMEEQVLKLSREFERRWNTKSYFSGGSKGGDHYLIKEGVKKDNIHLATFEDNKKDYPQPHKEYIKAAEERYGFNCWDIWQISAPRKKSRMRMDADKVLYWMEYFIRETENCFQKYQPDYVIFYGIASFGGVILYKIALHHKIKVLQITNSRVPNRFSILDNPENQWPLLIKEYDKLKKRDLSTDEINKAEKFITNFKEKPPKPDGTVYVRLPWREKIKKHYTNFKIFRYRKQIPDLKQFFWPLANKVLDITGTFSMPVNREKYVYYPLHVDPEVSTSFFGKWYVNQLALIENIARSVPCDYKLYVKEHPYNYSSRPFYFRKEIKRFSNVRLISPHANGFELIKNSSLVLTITGTAGWEAILLERPVLVLGEVHYNIFRGAAKINNIKELPAMIKKMVGLEIDELETLRFITAIFNSTFEGIGATPGDSAKALEPKNIALLVDGIEGYLQKTWSQKDVGNGNAIKKERVQKSLKVATITALPNPLEILS